MRTKMCLVLALLFLLPVTKASAETFDGEATVETWDGAHFVSIIITGDSARKLFYSLVERGRPATSQVDREIGSYLLVQGNSISCTAERLDLIEAGRIYKCNGLLDSRTNMIAPPQAGPIIGGRT